MDIVKWAFIAVVVLILSIVSKTLTPRRLGSYAETDELLNGFALDEPVRFDQHFRSLKGYVVLFLITTLFDRDYENVIVRLNWMFRDMCWIPWPAVVGLAAALAVWLAAAVAINSTENVYRATVAIVMEQLWVIALALCLTFVYVQGVYLLFAILYRVAWNPPDWIPGPLIYMWRFAAVGIVPFVPFAVFFVVKTFLPAGRAMLRSVAVLGHVLAPLLLPARYEYVSDYKPSAEFLAPDASPVPLPLDCYLLLVSDTHLAAPGQPVIDSGRPSNATIAFVQRVAAEPGYAALIHAGDITDRGDPAAWEYAPSLWGGMNATRIVVPGNHDVHFQRVVTGEPFTEGTKSALDLGDELARFQRFSDEATPPVGVTPLRGAGISDRVFFPTVTRVPGHPVLVVALNSNRRPSNSPITNALGIVGRDQLDIARRLIQQQRQRDDLLLVVLHHHVLLPSFNIQHGYLRCLDAKLVLRFAADARAEAIVHGHKHMPYVCRYLDSDTGHSMLVVSCGSAHHSPVGRFADVAGGPSCYRMCISDGRIVSVCLVRDMVAGGAMIG